MRNERSANEAIADYNQKEWEQRKPVQKVGFFSKLFKVV